MAKSTLTLEVDDGLRTELSAVASRCGLTPEQLLRELVQECVSANSPELDQWIRGEIQVGIEQANAGLVTPAEEVETEFSARRRASLRMALGA